MCVFKSLKLRPAQWESVSLAPHGEGHQAVKGIDSAELIQKRFLFIVCHQNTSPSAIPAECTLMQYIRHTAAAQRPLSICSCFWYLHALTQVPHRVFIYSMYTDTQLDSTMQVRKMPLGEIICSGWIAPGLVS